MWLSMYDVSSWFIKQIRHCIELNRLVNMVDVRYQIDIRISLTLAENIFLDVIVTLHHLIFEILRFLDFSSI